VAEAAVTDTHPLIYDAIARPARLGRRAHLEACERQQAILYVPAVVVWECALLARTGRVDLGRPEQVYLAAEAQPDDDPFDALICAAARSLGLPLMTRDEAIRASRLVKVLW